MEPEAASSTPPSEIHLPEDLNYGCLRCGRSRRMIEELERDGTTADEPLASRSERGPVTTPFANRGFPFTFIDTPGGAYAGVSFSCTAVQENKGPPLGERREAWAALYAQSSEPARAAEEILLATQLPISWAHYIAIEEDLAEILRAPTPSVAEPLIAQSAYLVMLSTFLNEARKAAGTPPGEMPEAASEPLKIFRKTMAGPERRWERLFAIASKPTSAAMLRRVMLGFITAFRRRCERRHGRLRGALHVLGAYFRHAAGSGRIALPFGEGTESYTKISGVRFEPEQAQFDELLRRFFAHCLWRKDLLRAGVIKLAHNLMLMRYGLIHWLSAALAASEGCPAVELEHLGEALRAVEVKYGPDASTISTMYASHPRLVAIMEEMFRRPTFAFAMARHEKAD